MLFPSLELPLFSFQNIKKEREREIKESIDEAYSLSSCALERVNQFCSNRDQYLIESDGWTIVIDRDRDKSRQYFNLSICFILPSIDCEQRDNFVEEIMISI